jgi:hypothetical protein
MSDKTELEVSSNGVKASLPASQAGELGAQMARLIGPLLEGAELVTDYIRLYRQTAVLKGLRRVRDLARELDIPLKPVPPKFLLPWLEGVSLEGANEEQLNEMWAQLLLGATLDPADAGYIFIDILKKLRNRDAKTLERMWHATGYRSSVGVYMVREAVFGGPAHRLLIDVLPPVVTLGRQKPKPRSPPEQKLTEMREVAIGKYWALLQGQGFEVREVAITYDDVSYSRYNYARQFVVDKSIPSLAALGLIEEMEYLHDFDTPELDGAVCKASYYALSPFGLEFLQACHPTDRNAREASTHSTKSSGSK